MPITYSPNVEAAIHRVMKARRVNREQAVKVVLEANCLRAGKGK